ncbi:MAG TPA: CpaF family protein [Anaerolineae bacterium]|nr:CpaF family protein [Anaerolineae bacterium]
MGVFGKRKEQPSAPAQPATTPKPAPPKAEKKEEVRDSFLIPLEPDPPGTPTQRGFMPEQRAALLKMQIQIADNIRKKFLAPTLALDLPLERTPEREQVAREKLDQLLSGGGFRLPPSITQEQFYEGIMNEIFGFGPIQPLIDRTDLTEIMVNGPYIVFVEMKGRLSESGFKFLDDDHVERIIKRIVLPLGRVASSDHPLIDARLPDGSRVNAVLRPCAIDGPNITIRKFSKDKLTYNDLLKFGSITEDMVKFLEAAVASRRNIIVSGGTGSGKTTLINILSAFIPEHERTVTIEDAAELQLRQRNVVRLETKKPNPNSPTEVTIRHCVINALRMRPERIVVGECRGGEALDMLQAMNTGHDGSMTTIHANTPRDCISRLETLVLMAGADLPLMTVRRQIASAIHMIVQASRLRDGSRKVVSVSEILGMEGENVIMQEIYKFFDEGDGADGKIQGYHSPTGIRPNCSELLVRSGFNLPPSMFMKKPSPYQ